MSDAKDSSAEVSGGVMVDPTVVDQLLVQAGPDAEISARMVSCRASRRRCSNGHCRLS